MKFETILNRLTKAQYIALIAGDSEHKCRCELCPLKAKCEELMETGEDDRQCEQFLWDEIEGF